MTMLEGPGPHDLEAEAAVISAVIVDPSALARTDGLRPEDFHSEAHRRMFEACLAVAETGNTIDSVAVGSWLREHGRYAQVGGAEGIMATVNSEGALCNVAIHAGTIREHAKRRRLLLDLARDLDAVRIRLHASTIDTTEGIATLQAHVARLSGRYGGDAEHARPLSS